MSEKKNTSRAKFGWGLRSWRNQKGIPLKAIAFDLDVSIETVSAWERGDQFPTPEHLDKLSRYTGIPVCRFFCHRSLGSCSRECPVETIQA